MRNKRTIFLIAIIGVFGIIYSLISLVNNYNFRTYALDLGAYTNALYDYIHFRWNDSAVYKGVKENLLADHFDLYLILFSPLSLLFKTYTLLILQIFFILLGGLGIYKYFSLSPESAKSALYATIYFYLIFGVFAAVSYDYHSNTVAASLVPWFFYFVRQRKIVLSSLMLMIILVSKENISLWAAFICLGFALEYRKEPYLKKYLILASLFCLAYFITITSLVMPWISNNFIYSDFKYSYLGNNSFEAALHLLQHPLESAKALFINHNNTPHGDHVKAELHILLLFSGLPLLVFKPQYFLMLVPIYFQKLYHDNYAMWGIGGQYSIEFAPILAIGIFMVINELHNQRLAKLISIIVLLMVLICTVRTMDKTVFFTNKSAIRFYQASHYTRDYSVKKVYEELSAIPDDAVVSAQSPFLPHLAYRDNIYQFPIIKDAEYVIYSDKESPYPMNQSAFDSLTSALEGSDKWNKIYKGDGLTILKKSVSITK